MQVTSYQGELDGLCGPYAIVNALSACGLDQYREQLFQEACKALSPRRWPELLWTGTTFNDLQRMIRACLDSEYNTAGIVARYPFQRFVPATNDDYWARFDEVFAYEGVQCGIVGMRKPSDHWIVISRDNGRLQFTDSDPFAPSKRKNKSSLFAGLRRHRPSQWLIDRKELVVFFAAGEEPD